MNNDLISRSALLNQRPEYLNSDHVDIEKALFAKGWNACNSEYYSLITDAAALEVEPVRHGCQYCSGEFAEYQHSIHTKVYINTIGKAQALITECNACPPYADCSMRGLPVRSAFVINFCPNCGRRLDAEVEHAAN